MNDLKQRLYDKLETLPMAILSKAQEVLEVEDGVGCAKQQLARREHDLLAGRVEGVVIDGKNGETRSAQMWPHTEAERRSLADWERCAASLRLELRFLQDQLAAARAQARLLGGHD